MASRSSIQIMVTNEYLAFTFHVSADTNCHGKKLWIRQIWDFTLKILFVMDWFFVFSIVKVKPKGFEAGGKENTNALEPS